MSSFKYHIFFRIIYRFQWTPNNALLDKIIITKVFEQDGTYTSEITGANIPKQRKYWQHSYFVSCVPQSPKYKAHFFAKIWASKDAVRLALGHVKYILILSSKLGVRLIFGWFGIQVLRSTFLLRLLCSNTQHSGASYHTGTSLDSSIHQTRSFGGIN